MMRSEGVGSEGKAIIRYPGMGWAGAWDESWNGWVVGGWRMEGH